MCKKEILKAKKTKNIGNISMYVFQKQMNSCRLMMSFEKKKVSSLAIFILVIDREATSTINDTMSPCENVLYNHQT